MSSKSEKERQKQIQDKCQMILSQLLRDEDNKYCVDCDAKGPRWASWNLGIFLCIRCAGIHRNLGVHISKVKSVNLDTWTPEQVTCLQQMGNSRARAVYEANLPDNFRRPQTDSSLEAFVRAKYEQKKYIAKEWVPPPMPKPSFEFEEIEKKKPKDKKLNKSGLEVPLPTLNSVKKISSSVSSNNTENSTGNRNSTKEKPSSGAIDLLGLDAPSPATSADDPFGGFLSAESSSSTLPTPSPHNTSKTTDSDTVSQTNGQSISEQDSLFAQLSAEDAQKKQPLSKESILSLYSQTPPIQQQMLGMQMGAMFSSPQPAMFASPGVQMGYSTMPSIGTNIMPGAPMMASVPQANIMGTNPFLAPGSCGSLEGSWYSATNPVPQPAFGQLQQQMGSLSLTTPGFGGVAPPPTNPVMGWPAQQPGQTLSTNLWQ